uniref:mediator of DNA damage checkpoint protein 1 n=1 Tax=Doryrhamphus excisus TaxID=161450 RepID=UPI0025AECCDF|nr:mediator of DNA damage checkpoint protein 1 [Doryrhamphus excisus]XP_057908945.1 mediator of DNA damage checkpoint protein 1 [Doryrhamphus excisus]
MDATQVINDSILESDEEDHEEKPNSGRKPLAKLCILKNDHIPERDFPLFVGDNVLGRDPSTCTLPLPAPSVSKQHATISISVYRRRGSHIRVDMEALVWDLGSMNGTRKGRRKLTPNVRYSLSEGDRLVVADIPCQYITCEDAGIPESRTAGLNFRYPDTSIEKQVKVRASGSTNASVGPSLLDGAQKTPAETTPVQLQRMLVPESDSDSDGEIQGQREGRYKSIGSDSDSYNRSATFLSPTNNIVPESEDESLITLSSSAREKPYRHVSFSKERDIISPVTVDDSDEGEGAVVNGPTPGGMRLEEKKHGVQEQPQSNASFMGEGLLQVSTSTVIPDFNVDSDTDVEAEAVQFHMDSDTDVEDDGEAGRLEGTDADVSHDAPKLDLAPPVLLDDFQLDSDTDVDEGADNTSRDETPSRLDLKMGDLSESDDDQGPAFNTHPDVRGSNCNNVPVAVIPADTNIAASESADTDVDECNAPSAGCVRGQDSKTDMEDKMPNLPGIKTSGLHDALLQNCSTPVQERDVEMMETQAFLSPVQSSFKRAVRPTDLSSCSDSLEDEDFVVAETQPFIIQTREQVQGGLRDDSQASEHNSSGENVEELPSGAASFQLGLSDSSHLQSHAHAHALAMESTQAFVSVSVADTQAYGTPARTSHRDDFNMEATQAYEEPAKSPVRQEELALQETQAYLSQPYNGSEDDPEEETQPLDLPTSSPTLAVPETQPALIEAPTTNKVASLPDTRDQIPKEMNLMEEHKEAVGETCDEAQPIPETQLVNISEDEDSIPIVRKRKAKQLQLEDETQPLMSGDFSAAETQPTDLGQIQPIPTSLTEESDEEDPSPGLVQLQKQEKYTTGLAVDTQTVTQLVATCDDDDDDDESDGVESSPVLQPQPLSSCDVPVAETQPIGTRHNEERDDDDSIPGSHKMKAQPILSSNGAAVEVQPMTVAATQPMAISDNDETDDEDSIPIQYNKRKAKPLQLEEETQPLMSGDFSAAETQPMDIDQTQPIPTSRTGESDSEAPIPGLVQPQKEKQFILCLAVDTNPLNVAVIQPISDDDEHDGEDSIPVLHHNRKARPLEETQPLTSCDFSSSETQPIAASRTEENDDEDPVLASHEKVSSSNDVAVEVQPMTVAATQPMAISDNDETDDEDSIPIQYNKRKAKPLQLEEETQPLMSGDFSAAETPPMDLDQTQPIPTSRTGESDSEAPIPDLVQLEEETQPLTGCDIPVTETHVITPSPVDRSDSEGLIPVLVQIQKETQSIMCSNGSAIEEHSTTVAPTQPMTSSENDPRENEEEETQPLISCDFPAAETEPTAASQTMESDTEDLIPALPKDEIQLQIETGPTSSLNVAVTQPMATSENEDSDDEDSIPVLSHNKQTKQQQEETQSLSSTLELLPDVLSLKSQREDGDKGQRSSDDDISVAPRKPQAEEPQSLEISALGDGLGREEEEPATQPVDTSEDEELDSEIFIPGPRRRKVKPLQFEDETQSLLDSTSQSTENEPGSLLQRGTEDDVGTSSTAVGHSRTTQEEEDTENRDIRRTKARGKSVKSRSVKENMEKAKLQQTKDHQQNNGEHQSIQVEILESKINGDEIREPERKENEEQERLQKEIAESQKREERLEAAIEEEICERERTELKIEAEERPKTPLTGRRATRRTIAALTAEEQDPDDVPAKRTSSCSNSVSSEVSNASTQTSRGRGRVEKRSNGPGRVSTSRRQMMAVEEPPEKDIGDVLSRSSSSTSLASEMSCSSLSSRSRGRGSRQQGIRGKSEPEPSSVQPILNQKSAPKPPPRGRRGKKTDVSLSEDDGEKLEVEHAPATRGRRRTSVKEPTATEQSNEKNQSAGEDSSSLVQPVLSQTSAPKPTPRGRRGKKTDVSLSEDDGKQPPSPATRGRRRTNAKEPTAAELSNQRNQSAGEDSSLPKRTIRGQTVKSEAVEAGDDNQQAAKEYKRKGRKRELEAGGEEVKDDSLARVQAKRRGRIAKQSLFDTSSEDGSLPSVSGAAEIAKPQTPISSKTRKRKASVESSPGTSCTSSPPLSRRPRTAGQFYKVLFTGVVDETGEEVLSCLGGTLANCAADMNCLVTDKVRRTVKFLCAVAKGVPIVNTQWLEMSGKAGSFLPPEAFIVQDPEQEKKFSFCLQESLRLASSQPLLQGYAIHITKSVKPEPVYMKDIITCSGATFLPKMPSSYKPNTVVISCEEDWPLCRAAALASFPVVSAEFILSGILQYKLDFDTHKLSGPLDTLQPATGGKGRSRKKT